MRSRLLAAALATALIGPAMAADSVRGVTDNEIVIGTYTDLSGVTAMWGVNNTNAWRMVFDQTNAAGSAGRLQAMVFMNSRELWKAAAFTSQDILTHEVGHRWGTTILTPWKSDPT